MLLSVCEFIIFLEIITTSNFFGVIFSTLCKELYVFLQLFSLCLSLTLFFPQLCSLLFFFATHMMIADGLFTCWIWPASRAYADPSCRNFEASRREVWKDSEGEEKVDQLSLLAELNCNVVRLTSDTDGWVQMEAGRGEKGTKGEKFERKFHEKLHTRWTTFKFSRFLFSCLFFINILFTLADLLFGCCWARARTLRISFAI